MKELKFPECGDCRFFSKKFTRPQCGECGCGEFYEPKPRRTILSDDELMNEYRKTYDE